MDSNQQKSILQMARGAIQERVDYEMARVIDNIMDANTLPTAKRKLTMAQCLSRCKGTALPRQTTGPPGHGMMIKRPVPEQA